MGSEIISPYYPKISTSSYRTRTSTSFTTAIRCWGLGSSCWLVTEPTGTSTPERMLRSSWTGSPSRTRAHASPFAAVLAKSPANNLPCLVWVRNRGFYEKPRFRSLEGALDCLPAFIRVFVSQVHNVSPEEKRILLGARRSRSFDDYLESGRSSIVCVPVGTLRALSEG